jgi:hypothetical protein
VRDKQIKIPRDHRFCKFKQQLPNWLATICFDNDLGAQAMAM